MVLRHDEHAPPALSVLLCAAGDSSRAVLGLRDHDITVRHLASAVALGLALRQSTSAPLADAVLVDADREPPDDSLSATRQVRAHLPLTTPVLLFTAANLRDLFTAALPLMLPNVSLHCWPASPQRLALLIRGAVAAAAAVDQPWTSPILD